LTYRVTKILVGLPPIMVRASGTSLRLVSLLGCFVHSQLAVNDSRIMHLCVCWSRARIDVSKGWRHGTSEADRDDTQVQMGFCHS